MSCGCFHGLGENFGKLIAYCFAVFWEGLDFQGDFSSFFLEGKPTLPLTEENVEKLAVKLWAVFCWLQAIAGSLFLWKFGIISYFHFTLHYSNSFCVYISDSIDFCLYRGDICEDLCFCKGGTWWTSTISSERWRSWTSKKNDWILWWKNVSAWFFTKVLK